MIVVAEVTTTPMNAKSVMDGGNPIAWPFICACWLLAYRVKSGIFSESVAQKPTIPVSAGKKKSANCDAVVNFEGCCKIGPNPLEALIAQNNKANAATGRKMALKTSSFLMLSTPRYTINIFKAQ